MKSKNGTPINPTPPRTGMPAGIIGKAVAKSICDRIKNPDAKLHEASMAEIGLQLVWHLLERVSLVGQLQR